MASKKKIGDSGIDTELSFIKDSRKEQPAPRRTDAHTIVKERGKDSRKRGLRSGWTRKTFVFREEHVENLRRFAFWNGVKPKEALDYVLTTFFEERPQKQTPKGEIDG